MNTTAPSRFGDPSRYYAGGAAAAQGSARPGHVAMLVRVLGRLDAKISERVLLAYRQWNQSIREHIRSETALRLSIGDDSAGVPVRVRDSLPAPFARITQRFDDEVYWTLLLNRGLLEQAAQGVSLVEQHFATLCEDVRLDADPVALRTVQSLFERIFANLDRQGFDDQVRGITQDYLGAYFFHESRIELYWIPIAIVAARLRVPIEALTVVVLAHELAHAYTHLGRDIDGRQWETRQFASTDDNVVEGLAQFYTAAVCARFEQRYPAALAAYDELLKLQGGPYLAHLTWAEGEQRKGEIVRSAMIEGRARGITELADFSQLLASGIERIGKGSR